MPGILTRARSALSKFFPSAAQSEAESRPSSFGTIHSLYAVSDPRFPRYNTSLWGEKMLQHQSVKLGLSYIKAPLRNVTFEADAAAGAGQGAPAGGDQPAGILKPGDVGYRGQTMRQGLAGGDQSGSMSQTQSFAPEAKGQSKTKGVKATVKSDTPGVAEFAAETLNRWWETSLEQSLARVEYGVSCGVLKYRFKGGDVEFDRLDEKHYREAQLLLHKRTREPVGVRVAGSEVWHPRAWWLPHRPRFGSHYGIPRLAGAFKAWWELDGGGVQVGAEDVRRMWFGKAAAHGGTMRYPEGNTDVNGVSVPNRDIARRILEQARTMMTLSLPNDRDEKGNYLWDWSPAAVAGSGKEFVEYCAELSRQVWVGLEIPPEIVEANGTGAFAGRRVPQAAFYASEEELLLEELDGLRRMLVLPLVQWRFGPDADYAVETDPLTPDANQQQPQAPGGPPQQPQAGNGGFGMPGDGFDGFGGGRDLFGGDGRPPRSSARTQMAFRYLNSHGHKSYAPTREDVPEYARGSEVATGRHKAAEVAGTVARGAGTAYHATEHAVSHAFKAAVSHLPGKAQAVVAATLAASMATYTVGRKAAEKLAAESGADGETVARIGKAVAAADLLLAKATYFAAEHGLGWGLPGSTGVALVPYASLCYLGITAARNREATMRLAQKAVRKAGDLAREGLYAAAGAARANLALDDDEDGERVAAAALASGDPDRWLAVFMAALDETRDAGRAVELAGEAWPHMEDDDGEDDDADAERMALAPPADAPVTMAPGEDAAADAVAELLADALPLGEAWADAVRAELRPVLEMARGEPVESVMELVRDVLARHSPALAQQLHGLLAAAAFRASAEAYDRLPEDLQRLLVGSAGSRVPPDDAAAAAAPAGDDGGGVTLPMTEAAVRDLRERKVLSKAQFDALDQAAKAKAFTAAAAADQGTAEAIRDALAELVEEGPSLAAFNAKLDAALDGGRGSALSAGYRENLYRTGLASSYTAGREAVMSHPLVRDHFPFIMRAVIIDGRTTPLCRHLASAGINGTSIFRADDENYAKFKPPTFFQCRCGEIPLTAGDAESYGVPRDSTFTMPMPPAPLAAKSFWGQHGA